MNRRRFWEIVESAATESGGDCHREVALIKETLSELSPEEILAFGAILDALLSESYQADLWAAAYIIHAGASDDGFDYFRGWLISQGEAVYRAAIMNPDSLAFLPELKTREDPSWRPLMCQDILTVYWEPFEELTGQEPPPSPETQPMLIGEAWNFEDLEEMRLRFPKLWARFGWTKAAQ